MFIDTLIGKIKEMNNPTVAGLDPRLEYVPARIREMAFKKHGTNLKGAAEAILEFNRRLIDALYDVVPAVKPQLAYYEMYGYEGVRVLSETIRYAQEKGLLVIADGKRNDIGSTAEAYSTAYLGKVSLSPEVEVSPFGADALTVNPYLGYDGIKPFVDNCSRHGKGIFILVKTSNKSSGQLQDLLTHQGRSVYELVADLVETWGKGVRGSYGYSSVGAVVGATYPNQAKILRKAMRSAYFLVPGYGAQGGTARDVVHAFNPDGLGAIVNASRSIMCAWQSEQWQGNDREDLLEEAARAEALTMRDELNKAVNGFYFNHQNGGSE